MAQMKSSYVDRKYIRRVTRGGLAVAAFGVAAAYSGKGATWAAPKSQPVRSHKAHANSTVVAWSMTKMEKVSANPGTSLVPTDVSTRVTSSPATAQTLAEQNSATRRAVTVATVPLNLRRNVSSQSVKVAEAKTTNSVVPNGSRMVVNSGDNAVAINWSATNEVKREAYVANKAKPVVAKEAASSVKAPVSTKVATIATPVLKPAAVKSAVPVPAVPTAPRLAALDKSAAEKMVPASAATRGPVDLSSRHKDRVLLAQLEADLSRTERKLNQADADLSEGQRQLAAFNNTLRQAMLDAGPDAKGLHPFVKVAQRYAGTPYVWGGESGRGFDCSGFIIRVMRDLGYKALPHSAAEQFRYGLPIADPLLKPGDLVFFANTYKPGISHVGIYLGKRRFIHAAGTGLGTIVSSLDAPKFRAKYAGARRLVAGG
jgi:cell wall-associated NlpC family hydrolase